MANGCCDFVNGLECRLEYSQASSNQACRFRNFFFWAPLPELVFACFSPKNREMREIMSGPLTQRYFTHFLVLCENM